MTTKNNPTPNPTEYKLVVSREFNAARERVWQAWTQPEQIKSWLGGFSEMTVESARADLRVGGKFRIQLRQPDGEYFTAAGTYLEVKAPEKLVYTWDWEKDGAGAEFGELEGKETLLTIEFRAKGNRTELILTHERFTSIERRDRHEGGWKLWLEKLVPYVEGGK